MYTETQLADQRRSTRYQIEGNNYALLKQPQYKELGKIIDISQTGISFLCINQGDWDTDSFEIDILIDHEHNNCLSDQITLKNIPLKPIAYCHDNEEYKTSTMMRRCGVEFGRLTLFQRASLDLFILRHGFVET